MTRFLLLLLVVQLLCNTLGFASAQSAAPVRTSSQGPADLASAFDAQMQQLSQLRETITMSDPFRGDIIPPSVRLQPFPQIREPGRCSMYGTCDPSTSSHGLVNCVNNTRAVVPDFDMTQGMNINCAEYQGNACCNHQQYLNLVNNPSMATSKQLLARCPACFESFRRYFCAFTCSPDQSMFVQILDTQISANTSLPVVNHTLISVSFETSWQMFNSCVDVYAPAFGGTVMQKFFDSSNPMQWLTFLGQQGPAPQSPIQIDVDIPANASDFNFNYAMTIPMLPCNAQNNGYRCGCRDCSSSCVSPSLGPATPATASWSMAGGSITRSGVTSQSFMFPSAFEPSWTINQTFTSAPIVSVDGTLLIGSQTLQSYIAVDPHTHAQLWPLLSNGVSTAPAFVAPSTYLVAGDDGTVTSFDSITGAVNWHTNVGQITPGSSLLPLNEDILVVTANDTVLALHGTTAEWSTRNHSQLQGQPILSVAAGDENSVYICTATSLFSMPAWLTRMSRYPLPVGCASRSALLVSQSTVIVLSSGGPVFSFDRALSSVLWNVTLLQGSALAPVAVAMTEDGSRLFVLMSDPTGATNSAVVRMNPVTAAILQVYYSSIVADSIAVTSSGAVYLAGPHAAIVLDGMTMQLRGSYNETSTVSSSSTQVTAPAAVVAPYRIAFGANALVLVTLSTQLVAFSASFCSAPYYCAGPNLEPISCPAGSFCLDRSAAPSSCPPGFYCPALASQPTLCPTGSFCPGSTIVPVACPAGFYCPQGAGLPALCPSGYACAASAAAPAPCAGGSFCPTGAEASLPCPAGFFCPNMTGSPQPCTLGSYCPVGTVTPNACPPGFFCPPLASQPFACSNAQGCHGSSAVDPYAKPDAELPKWAMALLIITFILSVATTVFLGVTLCRSRSSQSHMPLLDSVSG